MKLPNSYSNYTKDVYMPQLEGALLFQDFICTQLHSKGIVLQNMTSKKYQQKRENLLGLEIKHDERFRDTGRLYIETYEKAHPDNERYVLSGIYREDECWLFGIGDYRDFWVFSKKVLRRLEQHDPNWLFRPQPTKTSKGFCIPLSKADEVAEKHFTFEGMKCSA